MKRFIFIAIFMLLAVSRMIAQEDLRVNGIFGGKYAGDPSVTETMISGEQRFLKNNRLTNFATFKGDAKTYAPLIQPLVLADGASAIGRNVRYMEGMLQYAFFMLKPKMVDGRKVNRYLYYLRNTNSKNPTVMVIYFDGPLSRVDADTLIKKLSK